MANTVNEEGKERMLAAGFTDEVCRKIIRRFNDKAHRELRKLKKQ